MSREWEHHAFVTARDSLRVVSSGRASFLEVANSTFQALNFAEWLLYSAAEYRESRESHSWVQSASQMIAVPEVMILSREIPFSGKFRKTRISRKNLWLRDKKQCLYCSRPLELSDATRDHIIPQSKGGKSCWENLVTCCHACNTKKGNRTPQEANMRLTSDPFKPLAKDLELISVGEMKSSWKMFIP